MILTHKENQLLQAFSKQWAEDFASWGWGYQQIWTLYITWRNRFLLTLPTSKKQKQKKTKKKKTYLESPVG